MTLKLLRMNGFQGIYKNKYMFKRQVKRTGSRTRMVGESTESLRLLLSSTLLNFKLEDIFAVFDILCNRDASH